MTTPRNGALITVLLAGMFVNLLNVSVINVMLPSIIAQFQIGTGTAGWLTTGFLLATGIVIAWSPWLTKRYQYKTLVIAAMAALVIGSAVCAWAPSFAVLLAGRLVQAIGYGILLPLSMIIVLAITPPDKLGVNMGVIGMGMMLAPAIGPTLAGISIDYLGWRGLFAVMAIIGVLVLVACFPIFRYHNPTTAIPLDAAGVVLVSAGLCALLYGVNQAGNGGWGQPLVLACLAGGLVLLAVFCLVERHSSHPLLNLRVFRDANFSVTVAVTMVLQMAFYGGLILMPLFFENVMGYNGVKTGLLLLPGSALIGVGGIFSGKLYDRFGIKPLAIAGTAVMTAAACLLARLTPGSSYVYALLSYALFALGVTAVTTPITTAAFAKTTPELHADAATVQNMLRQVAGAIGTGTIVTTMTSSASSYARTAVPSAQLTALTASHGITTAFILTIGLCLVTVVASFFLTSKKTLTQDETPEKPYNKVVLPRIDQCEIQSLDRNTDRRNSSKLDPVMRLT